MGCEVGQWNKTSTLFARHLIWGIKFNVKQVRQKPLEIFINWKVAGFLEFYIFPGNKNINMFLVILLTINTFT